MGFPEAPLFVSPPITPPAYLDEQRPGQLPAQNGPHRMEQFRLVPVAVKQQPGEPEYKAGGSLKADKHRRYP